MTVKASNSRYIQCWLSRNQSKTRIYVDRFTHYQFWQSKLTVYTRIMVRSLFTKVPALGRSFYYARLQRFCWEHKKHKNHMNHKTYFLTHGIQIIRSQISLSYCHLRMVLQSNGKSSRMQQGYQICALIKQECQRSGHVQNRNVTAEGQSNAEISSCRLVNKIFWYELKFKSFYSFSLNPVHRARTVLQAAPHKFECSYKLIIVFQQIQGYS